MAHVIAPDDMKDSSIQIRVPKKVRDRYHRLADAMNEDLSELVRKYLDRLAEKKGIAA
jgi:antitoxin component of RelBE/YafQ-DinJ toxin-antitoxin module